MPSPHGRGTTGRLRTRRRPQSTLEWEAHERGVSPPIHESRRIAWGLTRDARSAAGAIGALAARARRAAARSTGAIRVLRDRPSVFACSSYDKRLWTANIVRAPVHGGFHAR